MKNNLEDKNYQIYLRERESSIRAEQLMALQFDKTVLSLSAGALLLSITFLSQIAPQPVACSVGWIKSAWVAFILNILSTLASFLTSQKAFRIYREACEAKLLCSTSGTTKEESQDNKYAIVTQWLNYVSMFLFLLGVFFLAMFCSKNL